MQLLTDILEEFMDDVALGEEIIRLRALVERYEGPTYLRGQVIIDLETLNQAIGGDTSKLADIVFGVQLHPDGRVWVCVNAMTWLRFKPSGKPIEITETETETQTNEGDDDAWE